MVSLPDATRPCHRGVAGPILVYYVSSLSGARHRSGSVPVPFHDHWRKLDVAGIRPLAHRLRGEPQSLSNAHRNHQALDVELRFAGHLFEAARLVARTLESPELKVSGEFVYRPVNLGKYKLSLTCR